MGVNPLAARAFGARAQDYERGRPGWPADAMAYRTRIVLAQKRSGDSRGNAG
jgi:hypothetical protein